MGLRHMIGPLPLHSLASEQEAKLADAKLAEAKLADLYIYTEQEAKLAEACEEHALFFNNKITSIRASIISDVNADGLRKHCKKDATMGNFTCITLVDLCKTVTECNSSTSCIDPVPTAFFKRVFDSVSSHVLKIINTSLQTGIFPDAFKTAVVKPLLKKPNLDGNALINYRQLVSALPSRLGFFSTGFTTAVLKASGKMPV